VGGEEFGLNLLVRSKNSSGNKMNKRMREEKQIKIRRKLKKEGEKRKLCGSRLANQSSRKESLGKSNGFASKPTESHSFPRLLILTLHLSLSLSYDAHLYFMPIYIYIHITSKLGKTQDWQTIFTGAAFWFFPLQTLSHHSL
jgi:hypothetical protein